MVAGDIRLPSKEAVAVRAKGITGRTSNTTILHVNGAILLTAIYTTGSTIPNASFVPLRMSCHRRCDTTNHFPNNFAGHRNGTDSRRVLASHLISHTLHPLFPSGCRTRICMRMVLLSTSNISRPSTLTNFTTSTTVTYSSVPFRRCVSRIHMTHVGNRCIIGPAFRRVRRTSVSVVINTAGRGVVVIRNRVGRITRRSLVNTLGTTTRTVGPVYRLRCRLTGRGNASIGHRCSRRVGSRRLHRRVGSRLCGPTCSVGRRTLRGRTHRSTFSGILTSFLRGCSTTRASLSRRSLRRGRTRTAHCCSSMVHSTVHHYVLSRNLHLSNHTAASVHPV